MRIIETDNRGGDYPDEQFATPYSMPNDMAQQIAAIFNQWWCSDGDALRYWLVVEDNYKLQPGFEP